ncbi:hypothetical protein [Mycobacterium sp.]|uniref:hypothetical protein n=1 Tax=Mycobacterium sp. TaxID=1785 RepID=UPI0031CF9FC3
MRRLLLVSVFAVVAAELLALSLHDRRLVLWLSGAAAAMTLLGVRRLLGRDADAVPPGPDSDDLPESLRSWLTRTETMIRRSESTRADWDRHLRPMLARRFQMTAGRRQAKDPEEVAAIGRMLFGPHMWGWVDPNNVAPAGAHEPGPGRATLEDILQRLEQA